MLPISSGDSTARKRKHVGPVGAASSAYSKRRTPVACQVCRVRRTKCGSQRPGEFCVKTGSVCVDEVSELAEADVQDEPGIIERLDELRAHVRDISAAIQTLERRSQYKSSATDSSPVDAVSTEGQLGLCSISLDELLMWSAFDGLQPPRLDHNVHILPNQLLSGAQSLSNSLIGDLDTGACRACIDAFFLHVHVKNPVLERAETYHWYRSACANGIGWDAESCLVLLVIANGALSRTAFPSPGKDDKIGLDVAAAFFSAAQKRIGALMVAGPLIQARCLFLCGVYLMSILQPFEAWRAFSQALTASQTLSSFVSLQRGASATTSTSDIAVEESIYWSCWKSEREVRLELGLSAGFSNVNHPLLYPSLPSEPQGDDTRAWYFYLGEIALWRQEVSARTEIMGDLSVWRTVNLAKLAQLCSRLADSLHSWKESLPPSLDLNTDAEASDILRFVLKGRLSYNYELITWPFIYAAFHAEDVPFGTHVLVEMGLKIHYNRLVDNAPGFKYRHHGTWLMQRSSARSACVLLLAAHFRHTAILLPHGWMTMIDQVVEMLEYWQPSFDNGGTLSTFMQRLLAMLPSR